MASCNCLVYHRAKRSRSDAHTHFSNERLPQSFMLITQNYRSRQDGMLKVSRNSLRMRWRSRIFSPRARALCSRWDHTTNHRIFDLGIHIRSKGSTKSLLESLVKPLEVTAKHKVLFLREQPMIMRGGMSTFHARDQPCPLSNNVGNLGMRRQTHPMHPEKRFAPV